MEPEHVSQITQRCRLDSEVRALAEQFEDAHVNKYIQMESTILQMANNDAEMDRLWQVRQLD